MTKPRVRARTLLEDQGYDLKLSVLAGSPEQSDLWISHPRVQKAGLALAGEIAAVRAGRVQLFGRSEVAYLESMSPRKRREVFERYLERGVTVLVVVRGLAVPPELLSVAEEQGVLLLRTQHPTAIFVENMHGCLEEHLQAATSLHGVLVDVFGVGILILGKSGIGKSECALDLILRGHRLVADDIVDIRSKGRDSIFGTGSPIIKHHMEIRGLGIINVEDLFGAAAVRERKKIELIAELVEWDPHEDYDRLGIEERRFHILDVAIPHLVIPIRPGRNMTAILEVAARNYLLRLRGRHSAREFQKKLNLEIERARIARAVGDEVE